MYVKPLQVLLKIQPQTAFPKIPLLHSDLSELKSDNEDSLCHMIHFHPVQDEFSICNLFTKSFEYKLYIDSV